jgi:hypothetical protein
MSEIKKRMITLKAQMLENTYPFQYTLRLMQFQIH